ncbi:MAG: hypothetical protein BGO63_11300 [Candidatus Accumulibacter sp. 66-26]|nr:hypothetical protein [Accumulibacter sp.]OJW50291.1 MAG: hypothetical protein BGO63_11300 [Candidatus Accumulibacter sp. 66-26]
MAELTVHEFEVLAKILRSAEPVKTAAGMVLTEGRSVAEAVAATGLLQPSVSRTVKRFRVAQAQILTAYDRRNKT